MKSVTACLAVGLSVGLVACTATGPGEGARPQDDAVLTDAAVVAVTPYRGVGRGVRRPARITIELDDGSRHRVWLRPPLPAVGERLPVRVIGGGTSATDVEPAR